MLILRAGITYKQQEVAGSSPALPTKHHRHSRCEIPRCTRDFGCRLPLAHADTARVGGPVRSRTQRASVRALLLATIRRQSCFCIVSYTDDMSWVKDRLNTQKAPVSTQQQKQGYRAPESPPYQRSWNLLCDAIASDVIEFNDDRGVQFMVRREGALLQVIPKQPSIDTVLVQVDKDGIVELMCPITHPGAPRRGKFKLGFEGICSVGDFVGQPAPTDSAMSAEEFSKFALEPLLFPEQ